MKIILTGIAGFIGSHLARRLLRDGHSVIGIDDLNDYYAVSLKRDRLADIASVRAFEFVEADIADLEKMRALFTAHADATHIVHLAAQAGVRYSIERPELYVHANVMGQVAIFEAARKLDRCRHLVYASTSSVYGANRELPFSVGQRVETPVSLYSATKLAGEHIAYTYGHLHGLPATGFRFFTVYGPWGRPDMAPWRFAEAILAGQPIEIYGGGEIWRDFTYVDDLVEAIVRLIPLAPVRDEPVGAHDSLSPVAPWRVVNIGGGAPEKLTDLIAAIETALGREAERRILDPAPGDMAATFADASLLQALTGFKPATPLEVGVKAFCEWLKQYLSSPAPAGEVSPGG
jgi:UDP-glucuronate 4-epimerase